PAHALAALVVGRHLDLDDIGAPIGELAHASGARAHPRQVEHGEARKGKRRFAEVHWLYIGARRKAGENIPDIPALVHGSLPHCAAGQPSPRVPRHAPTLEESMKFVRASLALAAVVATAVPAIADE